MKNPLSLRLSGFTASLASLLIAAPTLAATYQWNGSVDSTWSTTANWNATGVPSGNTAGPAPLSATFAHRLNVNNGAGSPLVYDSTMGTTTYGTAGIRGLVIGSGTGTGSMTITGGTFSTANANAADLIGNTSVSGAVSSLTIAGGTFNGNSAGFVVNFGGTNQIANFNLTSGSANLTTLTVSGSTGGGTGTVNLDGGVLSASLVNRTNTSGAGNFNFNGGTLRARLATTTFMQGLTAANVKSGGAVIDSNGFDITVGQALLDGTGGGGLTKLSTGKLTLTGASTYTGSTTISAGTLEIGNGSTTGSLAGGAVVNQGSLILNRSNALTFNNNISGSGSLTHAGSGTTTLGGTNTYLGTTAVNAGRLDVTGSLTSNITVASGASLGGEGSTTGTVTFAGTSQFFFDPSSPAAFSAASVNATGATVTLGLAANSPAATGLVVLNAPGGITGTAGGPGSNFVFTGRGTTYLNGINTQLLFDYTPASLTWKGNDPGNPTFWDTATTNFANGASPDKFFTGDSVTFDDTAATFNVALQAPSVQAGGVVFNNNSNAYTLSGAALTGPGSLTKNGTNALTLSSTNTYGGGTVINAGSVNASVAGSLGSGAVTVNGSGVLNLTTGGLTYTGLSTGLSGSGTVNVTLAPGVATTTLNANNAGFSGTLNVGAGAVAGDGKVQLNGVLGAASTVNVLTNGTVYMAAVGTQAGAIVLNGGDTGESLGQLRLENGASWSGPVTLAGDITGTGDGHIGSNQGTGFISGAIGETAAPAPSPRSAAALWICQAITLTPA